jgi:peptidoglycan hydrolase-like protein with peptidoglycan-binding domain
VYVPSSVGSPLFPYALARTDLGVAPTVSPEAALALAQDLYARLGDPADAARRLALLTGARALTSPGAAVPELAQELRQRLLQQHTLGLGGRGAPAPVSTEADASRAAAMWSALVRQALEGGVAGAAPAEAVPTAPAPAAEAPAPTAPNPLTQAISASPSTWLRRPLRGPMVAELQRQLRAAGFDPGPADGYFGPVTERAVLAFQRAAGITVDGKVGPQTLGALLGRTAGNAGNAAGPAPASAGNAPGPTPTAGNAPGPVVSGPEAPVPATIDGMLSWARGKIGTPYAAVNPFRFGDVPWDGQPHKSVNGSGTVWNYPKGTQVFDCSGFVVAAYRQIGVDLAKLGATTSSTIANSPHLANVSREDLRPGDLITYTSSKGIGHVVIYLGNGQTIEASGGKGVNIGTVDWGRVNAIKRPPLPGA